MITALFILQLLLTLIIGSIWIYLIIIAGKYFGSKTGGFVGGLPSTALLSFFFIGFTQSPEIASEAATVFPAAYGATALFLVIYAWLIKRGLFISLSYGLTTWFILSAFFALINPESFAVYLIIYLIILVFSYYILETKLKIVSQKKAKINHPFKQIAIRSFFGGLIIMLAVFFAKLSGPVYGGILAAFPAMFISTLVISHKAFGANFSRAITKPLMITGMITIVIYAIAVKYFYVSIGLYFGTLISILISAICAFFTYMFIQHKLQ